MGDKTRNEKLRFFKNFLCGALIGVGAILPGVSGGVLAVIFDVYQPMMELLTHPRRVLPRSWSWLVPLGIGWAVGFVLFAKGIAVLLDASASVTIWLFIGLIVGTIPALFREAGRQGRGAGAWVSLILCFSLMLWGMYRVSHMADLHVEPNFWWCSFCGALWGMSVVIPGLTSSPVLIALDLYQPLLDGLSRLEWGMLLSTVPAMLLTIALLARLVSWFFRRFYVLAYHGILGVVLASTLAIIPEGGSGGETAASLACALGGFALAYFFSRLERKMDENG